MNHHVNPGNVTWIVKRLNDAMGNGQFTSAEVMLGVAEFAGRIITAMSDTPVQGMQCHHILTSHIGETVKAGFAAKGYTIGGKDA